MTALFFVLKQVSETRSQYCAQMPQQRERSRVAIVEFLANQSLFVLLPDCPKDDASNALVLTENALSNSQHHALQSDAFPGSSRSNQYNQVLHRGK